LFEAAERKTFAAKDFLHFASRGANRERVIEPQTFAQA
jgi:hypothetical protein